MQGGGIDLDETQMMTCLRQHAEQLWSVGGALCCLKICQHQVQPIQVFMGMFLQSLFCDRQWAQQTLHGRHQIFKRLHDISWWLSEAGKSWQQLQNVAVACSGMAQQSDPGRDGSVLHLCKVAKLLQLQPDPAHGPGEKVGGDVILVVHAGHLSGFVQNLQNTNWLLVPLVLDVC